jgi:hypothetical protein
MTATALVLAVFFTLTLCLITPSVAEVTFSARRDYPVAREPNHIISEDIDGDDYSDLIVALQDTFVAVLLNDGDGTFQTAIHSPLPARGNQIALADWNGDPEVDLAVAADDARVIVLFGNGDGSFSVGGGFDVSDDALSVVVEEINYDQYLDMIVGCEDGNVYSYLGAGGGTFVRADSIALPYRCYAVELSAFDADAHLDLAVAVEDNPGHVAILLGNGDGTFQEPTNLVTDEYTFSMAIANFNGDGAVDIAAGTDAANVHIFLGHGDGTFDGSYTYSFDDYVYWLEVSDFNLDGHRDLAGCTTSSILEVLLGNGDGSFRPVEQYCLGAGSYAAEAWHFDHDGQMDIAVGGEDVVSVMMGLGEGGFVTAPIYEVGSPAGAVAFGFLNPGTIEDLVVVHHRSNPEESRVSVLLGNSDGTFQPPLSFDTGDDPFRVAVGRFNDDGHDDVVTLNSEAGNFSVLLGNGDGTLQPADTFPAGNFPRDVLVGRLNGDDYDDLVIPCRYDAAAKVFIANGDGTFQAAVPYVVGGNATNSALGDLDGDTNLDLLVGVLSTPATATVFWGAGDGTFSIGPSYELSGSPTGITLDDLNADGAPDLVFAGNAGGVEVSLNDGSGAFGSFDVYADWDHFSYVVVGDFNDDRAADIAVTNTYSGSVLFLTGSGDGSFVEEGYYGVGADPYRAVTFDANDDGLQDVVTSARYPVGGACVLINTTDETPVGGSFYATATDDGTVLLRWTVSDLPGVSGFNVRRGLSPDGPFELLTATPLPPTASGSFIDGSAWQGTTFWYRLSAVLFDGSEESVGPGLASVTTGGTLTLHLSQAKPNPMSGEATFQLSVPARSGRVRLSIYSAAGRLVRRILDGPAEWGVRRVAWNGVDDAGRRVSEGVYFARLEAGGDTRVRKIVLLR